MVFAIDLEGVLAPEIWPLLGEHFDIPDLHLTTRDLGDFDELMHRRVAATRERGLTLRQLQAVAHSIEPYLGAREFLSRLRAMGQVIIISDTFHELAEPLTQNRFEVDERGLLEGFKLRIRGLKERIVSGFHGAGFHVAAVGDSLNDRSILAACDFPLLYRPVEGLRAQFPNATVAQHLDEALAALEKAAARYEGNAIDRGGRG
ncbi:MAG: bifunctional phosphoserine phosphatase/homoserine phosphotransferase ThrH [Candidatus Eisenbacteria bacterium]|uniref:Bifunctional phosphoserine phosphatase/homoserine phosphotransferase ThrH n=1 Tax=Eiseniibacteriota bacterium TaxID=2212470 RepID=A0A538UA18_UNCEI|nr:MAG: bifunctional phosphoserine phosphatase/homoserine phosphotransferase ThrH [Candidatus Eisenbacteria bacterium]